MYKCTPNFAVFISGRGSNLSAIMEAIHQRKIHAKLSFVLSDQKDAFGVYWAKKRGIPTYVSNKESEMIELLTQYKTDFLVLAGFLKVLTSEFLEQYSKPIINIHPSLLPKYGGKNMYGIHVHEAVIEGKERYTGATTHFVTGELDRGPIILQKQCEVHTRDPQVLAAQVLKLEHQLLVETVAQIAREITEGKSESITFCK